MSEGHTCVCMERCRDGRIDICFLGRGTNNSYTIDPSARLVLLYRALCPFLVFPRTHPSTHQINEPNAREQDGWDLDIQEDVEDECGKYGAVKHVYVDPKTPGGMVYALFAEDPVRDFFKRRGGGVSLSRCRLMPFFHSCGCSLLSLLKPTHSHVPLVHPSNPRATTHTTHAGGHQGGARAQRAVVRGANGLGGVPDRAGLQGEVPRRARLGGGVGRRVGCSGLEGWSRGKFWKG